MKSRISNESFEAEVKAAFKSDVVGKEIIFFDSVTSTNDSAMEIGAQRENPEGIVVVSDSQTGGRGRLGRSWVSPPGGNLYFTLLLRPPFPPREASLVSLAAAVAVVSAIREHTGLKADIKWPNDILIKGKKTAGILMEMKSDSDRIRLLALGIGINVNLFPEMLPEDIRVFATSLKAEGGEGIRRAELFGEILSRIEYWYKILLNGDKEVLFNEWCCLDSTIGRKIRFEYAGSSGQDRIISGIAEGIDDEGRLLVRLSSGRVEEVSAGDVTILKDSKQ